MGALAMTLVSKGMFGFLPSTSLAFCFLFFLETQQMVMLVARIRTKMRKAATPYQGSLGDGGGGGGEGSGCGGTEIGSDGEGAR